MGRGLNFEIRSGVGEFGISDNDTSIERSESVSV